MVTVSVLALVLIAFVAGFAASLALFRLAVRALVSACTRSPDAAIRPMGKLVALLPQDVREALSCALDDVELAQRLDEPIER